MKYSPISVCLLGLLPVLAGQNAPERRNVLYPGFFTEDRVVREVRHELLTLAEYSVFDDLAYSVNGGAVTLYGRVTRPTLRRDAAAAVKRVAGVAKVADRIHVLPRSEADDHVRLAAFRAIFGDPALNRYAVQAIPPIHIVVENGNVTLVGAVDSESDRNLAGIRAGHAPGVFGVTNELRVGR